ncbi:hypothetical protein [Actinomadura harenae]|uniref:Uncharacterized protein n=1 Tax=Actinomadura harenae TaxID=2483351 RepID=A0A3M2LUC8_9ACTN|nr:hypothetical protein [Actinomadura harenae]RMI40500.1 hypothetical protein EBO15_26260 [Actinomadura harenae]
MDGASEQRMERVFIRLAVQIVTAAYAEAMRRHGLLPSTIAVITTYAEENLAALEREPDGVPTAEGR